MQTAIRYLQAFQHSIWSELTMLYSKYAVTGLLWMSGLALAQPTTHILESVVLPASAIQNAKNAPAPVNGLVHTHLVVLPALEWEKALSSDEATDPTMKIGLAREVAATSTVAKTQQALQWNVLPQGQQVSAINIQSTGAYGLRAGVLVERIPDTAQLRIYSQEHPDAIIERSGAEINALLTLNRNAGEKDVSASTWWTPDVGAGDTTVEIVLPAGTPVDALRIAIPRVSHIYQNLSLPTDAEWAEMTRKGSAKATAASTCEPDITCTEEYQTERNAVARMVYTLADGATSMCTGTLLNNTKADYVPYFLTANHCISTQAEASSLQTNWFYHASRCGSGVPGANVATRTAGATLLHATSMTDSALLKLNEMPPVGVTLAGWDARTPGQEGDAVYGLHHALGNLLEYNQGILSGRFDCHRNGAWFFDCEHNFSSGSFYGVRWSLGDNARGSSGSALFRNGHVIATLQGGGASCTRRPENLDYYGRFDKVFNDRLWQWLANGAV
ncbi:trypsin-like peptidase domain-containing protein [Comamonas piscis]